MGRLAIGIFALAAVAIAGVVRIFQSEESLKSMTSAAGPTDVMA
jgi:hypothetical protein